MWRKLLTTRLSSTGHLADPGGDSPADFPDPLSLAASVFASVWWCEVGVVGASLFGLLDVEPRRPPPSA